MTVVSHEIGACSLARRELVRHLIVEGLSERRALAAVRMSASALRYTLRPDGNGNRRQACDPLRKRQPRRIVADVSIFDGASASCSVIRVTTAMT